MLKSGGLDLEGEILIIDIPALGQTVFIPRAAAGLTSLIAGICVCPQAMLLLTLPNNLGVRSYQAVLTPVFKLLAR